VNRTFDFYEYAGFIIPGAVVVMAVVWLFPESRALFSKEGVTLGELGLFVIIAYAAGQLVQAIGNFLEWLWWKPWGGMPTGRVLTGKLPTPEQHQRLIETLQPALGGADPSEIPEAQRRAIVREVYAEVLGAGKAARIEPSAAATGSCAGSPPRSSRPSCSPSWRGRALRSWACWPCSSFWRCIACTATAGITRPSCSCSSSPSNPRSPE
jgi:hypothetical protein